MAAANLAHTFQFYVMHPLHMLEASFTMGLRLNRPSYSARNKRLGAQLGHSTATFKKKKLEMPLAVGHTHLTVVALCIFTKVTCLMLAEKPLTNRSDLSASL